MNEKLIEALSKLDVNVDSHWTAEGLVNLKSFQFLYGQPITREQLDQAAPGLSRVHFVIPTLQEAPKPVEHVEPAKIAIVGSTSAKAIMDALEALQLPSTFDVTTLSDTELAAIHEGRAESCSAMNHLINAVAEAREKHDLYLNAVAEEHARRFPPEHLTDTIKAFHAENAGHAFPCDAPRQRVVQPRAPMNR